LKMDSQFPQPVFKHLDIPRRALLGEHVQGLLIGLPRPFPVAGLAATEISITQVDQLSRLVLA